MAARYRELASGWFPLGFHARQAAPISLLETDPCRLLLVETVLVRGVVSGRGRELAGRWGFRVQAAWRALVGGVGAYFVTSPGEERALRFIAMVLFLQRASYLVPTTLDAARTGTPYRSLAVNVVMVAVAVLWNGGLALIVRRRGWFPRWAVGTDVAVVCVLLVVGTMNVAPWDVYRFINWPTKLALASAALVGAAVAPRWIVPVLLAPLTVNFGTAAVRFGSVLLPPSGIFGVLDSYFWFTVIAYVMRRYLCRQGRALDEVTRRQLELEARRAAERARYAERIAQYRTLHDTVLTTLTAIARGGLDHRTEAVRTRCAAEAGYVRRLVDADAAGGDTALGARLGEVITEAGRLGLRVHYLRDGLPDELPSEVVDRVAEASREALNNVLAHSGTRTAWLTATWDDGRLLVRIVDRGRGFDRDTTAPGFGVRSSIVARLREGGGEATVVGMPGEGVCVDLIWPAGQRE
jgi:signal transduction histidine kinase